MKIAFITVFSPFGQKEAFISAELKQISQFEKNIFIFPLIRPGKNIYDKSLLKFVIKNSTLDRVFVVTSVLIYKIVPVIKILFDLARKQKINRFLYTLYFLPKTLELTYFIERNQITHIHAYWGGSPATCALIANKLTKIDFSFSLHRGDIEINDILKMKTEEARFVRSISQRGKEIVTKLGATKDKVFVIHLGVKIPNRLIIRKKNRIRKIVTTSNLVKTKTIITLIKRISDFSHTRLFIIGEGPEKRKLKRTIQDLNANDLIELKGYLPHKRIFALYSQRRFDLFALSSKTEGIPVSAMEAMAYMIPVAVSNVGAVKELINEKNGYLLKNDASNISTILEDIPNRAKIMAARNTVLKDFNIEINSKKFIDLIKWSEKIKR